MGKAITLKSRDELQYMLEANGVVAEVLQMLRERIRPGVSTWQMDQWAEEMARGRGCKPAFKGYHGFPASLCVSLNEQVVHGIPSKKVIVREGDIVSLDFGVAHKGFYGDAAVTVAVGEIDPLKKELLRVTHEALYLGIKQAVTGNRIRDISRAIQTYVEGHGFFVVRQFVGHGIGAQLHEGPEVPNFDNGGRGVKLQEGMVLAIEPMVNIGTGEVIVLNDGWTAVTKDGQASAHFEHSVAITEKGPWILSEAVH